MKTIPLTQGYEAIIDDEDFAEVSKHKWYASYSKETKRWEVKNHSLGRLSRFLMKSDKDKLVDHENHDTFDNRRQNLRVCTFLENSRNRKQQFNQTGYKGVSVYPRKNFVSYKGKISVQGKAIVGTCHRWAVLAAKDYDDLAKKHFGLFAYLNFPHSIRRAHIARMIMSTNGRIFKVTFIKRTGEKEQRTIFGCVGVKKHLKNIGCSYSPEKAKLIVIFSMQDRQYKAIPIEGIHAFYFAGKKYRVD